MREPHQAAAAWLGSTMFLFKLGATTRAKLQAHSSLSHSLASCSGTLREMQDNGSFVRGQDMDTAGRGGWAGCCAMCPGEQSWAGGLNLLQAFFKIIDKLFINYKWSG